MKTTKNKFGDRISIDDKGVRRNIEYWECNCKPKNVFRIEEVDFCDDCAASCFNCESPLESEILEFLDAVKKIEGVKK